MAVERAHRTLPTEHGIDTEIGAVYTVFGDKGNGLSNEFLDPANTVRVLEPHAAARTPLKNPENSITDPSESQTCDEEK